MWQSDKIWHFIQFGWDVIDPFPNPGEVDVLFFLTFATTVFSAGFGVTKFLKNGPCKLVPLDGKLGGYGQGGFILAFFNVTSCLLAKGTLLQLMAMLSPQSVLLLRETFIEYMSIWATLSMLLPFVYVSTHNFSFLKINQLSTSFLK